MSMNESRSTELKPIPSIIPGYRIYCVNLNQYIFVSKDTMGENHVMETGYDPQARNQAFRFSLVTDPASGSISIMYNDQSNRGLFISGNEASARIVELGSSPDQFRIETFDTQVSSPKSEYWDLPAMTITMTYLIHEESGLYFAINPESGIVNLVDRQTELRTSCFLLYNIQITMPWAFCILVPIVFYLSMINPIRTAFCA